jgi:hypothetical protein
LTSDINVQKNFFSSPLTQRINKLEGFVLGRPFQPSLILVRK